MREGGEGGEAGGLKGGSMGGRVAIRWGEFWVEHEVCSCAGGVGVVVYGEGQEVTEQ